MSNVTIEFPTTPAPSTPLNLRIGVIYAPRAAEGLYVGYAVLEVEPNVFELAAYEEKGVGAIVYRGELLEAWRRLCVALGMA